jgi:hypothetical protein
MAVSARNFWSRRGPRTSCPFGVRPMTGNARTLLVALGVLCAFVALITNHFDARDFLAVLVGAGILHGIPTSTVPAPAGVGTSAPVEVAA